MVLTSMLLALSLSSDWTPDDTKLELAFVGLGAADIGLTIASPQYVEQNPILGAHPSTGRVLLFGTLGLAGHAAVAWALPQPWRRAWQCGGIAVEAVMVVNNLVVVSGSY